MPEIRCCGTGIQRTKVEASEAINMQSGDQVSVLKERERERPWHETASESRQKTSETVLLFLFSLCSACLIPNCRRNEQLF